jgi:hypothetical protein
LTPLQNTQYSEVPLDAEVIGDLGLAHIQIDQQHRPLGKPGDTERKIAGSYRFAAAGCGGRHG